MKGVIDMTPRGVARSIYDVPAVMQPDEPLDRTLPWAYGPVECSACSARWVGAWRIGTNLQCHHCGSGEVYQCEE